jgi:predicted RNA binding protein YcfA (HicA-like mRNA interferase family)
MAGRVPVVSGREAVRIFSAFGWKFARQSSSHIILVKDGELVTLSVPDHREVARGTLRSLIRSAGLTVEELATGFKQE